MTDHVWDVIKAEWDKIEAERAEKLAVAGPVAKMTRRNSTVWYKLAEPIEMTDNNRKRYVIDSVEVQKSISYAEGDKDPYISVRGHGHLISATSGKPLKKRDYMFLDDATAKYFG